MRIVTRTISTACVASILAFSLIACGSDGTDDSSGSTRTSAADDDTATDDERAADSGDSEKSKDPGKKSGDSAKDSKPKHDTADKDTQKSKADKPRGKAYLVTEVVDGDTVHLDKPGETSIRIIGIDTPETVHPSEPVECGGPAASAAAERLLSGKRVRLVYDPSQGRTDSYGRVLGYLDVPGIGDYGLRMVNRGLAAEYTYDTAYRKQAQYLAAQQRAQNAGRGVWNRCGGVDTPLEQPTADPQTQDPPDGGQGSGCAAGYSPCVPPYPPDLDCADVDGPITITGDDPHGFDADGDGIGCDS